jgi:hypothetical protein
MQKVLPGASREALGFIAQHWKSLVQMSVIPMLAYLVLMYVQLSSLVGFYREMGAMMENGNLNPAFMTSYMNAMGINFVVSIIGGALMTSLFVQIIRFQKGHAAQWLLTGAEAWKAAGMVFVYLLGIMMLTFVAYFVGVIVIMVAALIVGFLLSLVVGSDGAGVVAALLGVVAGVSVLFGLLWFMFRFLAGLPGVALGHSPDFFKDLWQLPRGETWGLPLRALAAMIVFCIPLLIVLFIVVAPVFEQLTNTSSMNSDAAVFAIMADMMERMAPYSVILMFIYMPFVWFMSLLLGIAFQRFRERQTA